jgi:signal transduction histidine kinase
MENRSQWQTGSQVRPTSTYQPELDVESRFARDSFADDMPALVHDARNMVSALSLYCDLLEEPGVLTTEFRNYASELRLVWGASMRLLDQLATVEYARELKLTSLRSFSGTATDRLAPSPPDSSEVLSRRRSRLFSSCDEPVESVAAELLANQTLLSALIGPAVTLSLSHSGGACAIAMRRDDLTRVLVNLAKNAAEAMPGGGHLQIDLVESEGCLSLSFTDNGPGIPQAEMESIFSPGSSASATRGQILDSFRAKDAPSRKDPDPCRWPVRHRGLGLSIVRSLVSAAGGSVWAANLVHDSAAFEAYPGALPPEQISRICADGNGAIRGAIVTIEFPLLKSSNSA